MCMSLTTFFSICIPAFNPHGAIFNCLSSIIDQNYDDYEVIIVDDGSDEPLRETISSFIDSSKIRVIRQANSGTYSARQMAISAAHGRYIYCMDADDCLRDNSSLASLANELAKYSFPDVLLLNAVRESGDCCVNYGSLSNGPIEKHDVIDRFFLDCGWNSMSTMVFKRRLFKLKPARPKLIMAEDRLQKAEIFSIAESFALCNMSFYLYKDTDGSAMNSPFEPLNFYNRTYVAAEILGFLDALGANRKLWARSFNGYVVASLIELINDKRRPCAERINLYPEFRDVRCCDEALCYVSDIPVWKDRVCLEAFRDRKWVYLDALLLGRRLTSKVKHLFNDRRGCSN